MVDTVAAAAAAAASDVVAVAAAVLLPSLVAPLLGGFMFLFRRCCRARMRLGLFCTVTASADAITPLARYVTLCQKVPLTGQTTTTIATVQRHDGKLIRGSGWLSFALHFRKLGRTNQLFRTAQWHSITRKWR
uniref:Uncharacterized protein n=1 Tax=Anopheles darlingi TaxID=43151 RepID=A0A2M4DHG9_ANODA